MSLFIRCKGSFDQEFTSIEEAGRAYLAENFPDWDGRTSCIIPQIPWTQYNRYLGPEKYKHEASIKDKSRGDDAELAVYRVIREYSRSCGLPVFVICGLNFDSDDKIRQPMKVLSHCLTGNRLEQLHAFFEQWKQEKDDEYKLEIDFLLLHVQLGAIVAEVKAAKNPLNKFGKALTQVTMAKKFFQIFDAMLPIKTMLIFPNVSSERSESEHNQDRIKLDKLENEKCVKIVTNLDSLSEDINSVWSEMQKNLNEGQVATDSKYENILATLTALKCLMAVMITNEGSAKVSLDDVNINRTAALKSGDHRLQRHEFFPSNFIQKSKKSKNVSEIRDVKCQKLTFGQLILFLNREQINIYDCKGSWQILRGIAGTGKTILIQYKALEMKQKFPDTRVIVSATQEIVKHYREFFALQNVNVEVFDIFNFRGFVNTHVESFFQLLESTHIFIDEAQHYLQDGQSFFNGIIEIAKRNHRFATKLWIAIDPAQHIHTEKLESQLQQLSSYFAIMPLVQVMRCTPELMDYWYPLVKRTDEEQPTMGNRLFSDDVVVSHFASVDDAALSIAKEIKQLVKTGSSSVSLALSDCVIFVLSHMGDADTAKTKLAIALNSLGVPTCSLAEQLREEITSNAGKYSTNFEREDKVAIKLANLTEYIDPMMYDVYSLEWSVVFLVAGHSESSICKRAHSETADDEYLAKEYKRNLYLYATRCRVCLTVLCIEDDKDFHQL